MQGEHPPICYDPPLITTPGRTLGTYIKDVNDRPLSACLPIPRRFGRGGGCLAGERRGELYHLLALPAGKVLQVSAYAIHGPGQCGVGGRKAQDLFHRVPGLVSQVLPQSAQMSHPFVEWRRRAL